MKYKYWSGNGHAGPDHKRYKVPTVCDFPEGSSMRRSFSRAPGSLDLSVFEALEALPSGIPELDNVVNSDELQLAGMAMRSTVIQRQPSKPQPRQRIDHSESVVKSLAGSSKTMKITTVKPLKSLDQHKLMKEVPRNLAGIGVPTDCKSKELTSVQTTKPYYKMEHGKKLKYLDNRKVTPKSDCLALVRRPDKLQEMEPTSSIAPRQLLKIIKVKGKWIVKQQPHDVSQKQSLQITRRRISAVRDFPYGCGKHVPFVAHIERKKVEGKFQTREVSKNRLPHTNTQSQLITTQSEREVGIAERKFKLHKDKVPHVSKSIIVYKEGFCLQNKNITREEVESRFQTSSVSKNRLPRTNTQSQLITTQSVIKVGIAERKIKLLKDKAPHVSKSIVVYKEGFFLHNKNINTREEVKEMLSLFHKTCRDFLREEESRSTEGKHTRIDLKEIKDLKGKQAADEHYLGITKLLGKHNRIDLKAYEHLKSKGMCLAAGKHYLGSVPGTKIGDEFRYRVELRLTGLHCPLRSGIDYIKHDGTSVATSIVSSGGYANLITSDGVLEYSGSGGQSKKRKGNNGDHHQTLDQGNLALKNSIEAQTPVRVIYGLKENNFNGYPNMRSKPVVKYIYDGFYLVENCWLDEVSRGVSVYRFQLRKMTGQPMVVPPGSWV